MLRPLNPTFAPSPPLDGDLHRDAPDPSLDAAPQSYLRALAQSSRWKSVAAFGSLLSAGLGTTLLVVLALGSNLPPSAGSVILPLILTIGSAILAFALAHSVADIRFTTRDPNRPPRGALERSRRLVRIMAWITLIVCLAMLAAGIAVVTIYDRACLTSPGAYKLSVILVGIGSVWTALYLAAQMLYIRHLAQRMRDPWVLNHASLLVWLLPLLSLATVTGIATIAAAGLQLHLFGQLHNRLKPKLFAG